jgi:hypothetical protein
MSGYSSDARPSSTYRDKRSAVSNEEDGPAAVTWSARAHSPAPVRAFPRATVEIENGEGRLLWGADEGPLRALRLPSGLDPALGALAPKLAVAAALPERTQLPVYDTVGFLRHQLLLIRRPGVRVTAAAAPGIQSGVAAAFGAEPGRPEDDAEPVAVPGIAQIESAFALLAAHRWRFAPAITFAGSAAEWDAAIASGQLGVGLEALVYA